MKRKLFWVFNFVILSLFSMYTLASFTGYGTKQAYADTLKQGNFYKKSKHYVVVNKENHNDDHTGGMGSGDEMCTLTDQQATQLDAFFNVHFFNIDVGGQTVEIAAVNGKHLTEKELMDFLRATNQTLECQIIKQRHVFFLPVLPQIS